MQSLRLQLWPSLPNRLLPPHFPCDRLPFLPILRTNGNNDLLPSILFHDMFLFSQASRIRSCTPLPNGLSPSHPLCDRPTFLCVQYKPATTTTFSSPYRSVIMHFCKFQACVRIRRCRIDYHHHIPNATASHFVTFNARQRQQHRSPIHDIT